MDAVVIGVDPHKLSATIEVVDHREQLLGSGRFTTDKAGYAAMRAYVKGWPRRVWAVEGANGAGRPLAQRLVEAGEQVVDVPAKLAARVRLFDTGHNRKTDALDAHSIAVVAVRTPGLRVLAADGELEALRMLTDRRDELAHQRVQTVNRLQRLLSELIPGQRKRDLSALQAKAIARLGAPAGPGRQNPPPDGRRTVGRPGRRRREAEEDQGRAQSDGHRPRLHPAWTSQVSGRPARRGSCPTSATSPGSPTGTGSPPGPAPHPWTPPPASRSDTGSPAPGTGG